MPLTPEELEKKRAENIKKKEEERQRKIDDIKAKKAVKSAERQTEREKLDKAKEAEEARRKELLEKEKKRQAKIAEIEAQRAKKAAESEAKKKNSSGVKYSKRDVLDLKAIFDQYDDSGDGHVSLKEFTSSLHKNKKQLGVAVKTTREERRAAEGISLADLGESVFQELDVDGSGEVSFAELLKLMYPFATSNELEVMLSWVAPAPEPEPEPEPELSAAQIAELKQMFRLYDKDKSGSISKNELLNALQKTGLSKEEIKELFDKADTSGDDSIELEEFIRLMESTGMYS